MTGIPLAVVLLGLYTPLHATAVLLLVSGPWTLGLPGTAAVAGLALLYLAPPLAARVLLVIWGPPMTSTAAVGSPGFVRWWALCQLQMLFARLPLLEEVLRLVPGLYSGWLRLWGARIGAAVFWAPGVRLTDRSLVEVGDRALVGMGTHLVSHLVLPADGSPGALLVAPVVIGAGAVVGGLSILGPGARVAAGQTSPARTVLPPFWTWADGRRVPGAVAAPAMAWRWAG